MTEERIVQVADDLVDGVQEWIRETDDDDLRGVDALEVAEGGAWPWQVFVSMAEFVRDVPLEDEMRAAVDAAIRSVPGVTDVAEEDREVWIVAGTPSGEALVRAVGAAIDPLVERAASHLEAMDEG